MAYLPTENGIELPETRVIKKNAKVKVRTNRVSKRTCYIASLVSGFSVLLIVLGTVISVLGYMPPTRPGDEEPSDSTIAKYTVLSVFGPIIIAAGVFILMIALITVMREYYNEETLEEKYSRTGVANPDATTSSDAAEKRRRRRRKVHDASDEGDQSETSSSPPKVPRNRIIYLDSDLDDFICVPNDAFVFQRGFVSGGETDSLASGATWQTARSRLTRVNRPAPMLMNHPDYTIPENPEEPTPSPIQRFRRVPVYENLYSSNISSERF